MISLPENSKIPPKAVSVHDASPLFQAELEHLFRELEPLQAEHKWIAVVPEWNREWDIREHKNFLRLLQAQREKGWELVLHGCTHSHPLYPPWFSRFFASQQAWEFAGLNYEESRQLASRGLKIFEEAFGHMPRGFIPPNWCLTKGGRRALWDLGFEFTVSFREIEWKSGKREALGIDEMHFRSTLLYWSAKQALKLFSEGNHLVFHPKHRGESILQGAP